MADIFDTMHDISNATDDANKTLTNTSNVIQKAGKITGVSALINNQQNAKQATTKSTTASAQSSASIIPSGTCIIIPAAYSLTGQDRFLGKGAYESLVNMMNGSGECNNVIVVDANGNPSPNVYDQTPNGLVLKGTQTPVKFNYEENNGVKTPTAVALTETEFIAVANGMQKKGKGKFKTSDQGEAEDADNRSWWARWWKVVVAVATVAIGGLATFLLVRKYNKDKKSAENTASTLSAQASDLQSQINDLSNGNANTGSSDNTNDSTLAANGTIVNINESILNAKPGREY